MFSFSLQMILDMHPRSSKDIGRFVTTYNPTRPTRCWTETNSTHGSRYQ